MPQKKRILSEIRKKEREVRRNLIIDASIRLFAKQTFNKVHIRDIAVSHATAISIAPVVKFKNDSPSKKSVKVLKRLSR